jgi:hypothetical protein
LLRIHFTDEDLARTVVAPTADPLWEVVLSRFRLDEHNPAFQPWLRTVRGRIGRHGPAVRALQVLTPEGPYFPDLLTPPEGANGLEAGLAAIRAVPAERVAAEFQCMGRLPKWAAPLARGDAAAVEALVKALRALHNVLVAPFADVIQESVDTDRARRAQDLLDGGVHGLLAGFTPLARWESPVLEVDYPVSRDLRLEGRGIRLVPSYFCHGRAISLADSKLPPVLVYPITDTDRWAGVAADGLDALLGPTRSAVLTSARTGASTTELARRVGTSPASVSRHTGVLRAAGLLRTTRRGMHTVHSLTPLGESLIAGRA